MRGCISLILFFVLNHGIGQDISKQVDEYVNAFVETGDFSGCILILKQDTLIYDNCFGKSNYSFDIPNDSQTRFKIGSISKQFTAASILILEQRNLLNTKESINRFFPDDSIANKITIEQLLTHTSGLTDIYNIPEFYKLSCENITLSDFSFMILKEGLLFEPGSRYQYSNGGYAILAQIIEQVSGISYEDFLKRYIFQPLKMNATGHQMDHEVIYNHAVGYDPVDYEDIISTEHVDNELLKGSGSLYSTNHDLKRWINSVKNKEFLSRASYVKLLNNYGNNYGYGISVYNSFERRVFGHDGRVNGYIADYLHYEEDNVSIIITGNIQTGVSDFLRRDLSAIVFGRDYKSRAKTVKPLNQVATNYDSVTGVYSFGPNFNVYVEFMNGRLKVQANEGGYSELVPLADRRYFNRTLYSYVDFIENETDDIDKMIWTNNDGNSFEGLRLNEKRQR